MSPLIKNALVIVSLMAPYVCVCAEAEAQQNAPVYGPNNLLDYSGAVITDAIPVVPAVQYGPGIGEAPPLLFGPPVIGVIEPPALPFAPVIGGGDAFPFAHEDDHMGFPGGSKDAQGHLRGATAFYYRR